jgi:hypothetical protein
VDHDERRRAARLRLRARRRRDGQLRRTAIVLSIGVFGLLWAVVFAQMVSGHDPVLGKGPRVASASEQSRPRPARKPRPASGQGPILVYDPVTGTIREVPASSPLAGGNSPAPAPTPAPVVTSQS